MMRKLILAAALLPFCFTSVALAGGTAVEAPAACVKAADLVAQVQASADDSLVISVLEDFTGPSAKVLLDFYNSQPPQSEYVADEVVILHAVAKISGAEHPAWALALFKAGCKVQVGMFPSAVIKQVMTSSI